MVKKKNVAVIVAGGKGTRLGAKCNKQFVPLKGKPLVAHTLGQFQDCPLIDEIILVVGKDEIPYTQQQVIAPYGFDKVTVIVEGGTERVDSVQAGLKAITGPCDLVAIHDGARPFITQEVLKRTLEAAAKYGAAIAAVPVKDTIKRVDPQGQVVETPPRDRLWSVQTPQVFQYGLLLEAYGKNISHQGLTDDASLFERLGWPVQVVMGDYQNIKITTPEDLAVAEIILGREKHHGL